MEDQVVTLWNEFRRQNIRPDTAIRMIMKEARTQFWPLGQTMQLINQLRYGRIRKQKSKQKPAYLFGCQRDDEGKTLDPYTLQDIPEEFLISFQGAGEGQRYCFDIRSIGKAIHNGNFSNPLTREPFPPEVVDVAEVYNANQKKVLLVGGERIDVLYDTVFDLLVKILRTQVLLAALRTTNPFYNGESLYSLDLESEFIFTGDRIELYPFSDGVEQAVAHKKLFEYCSKQREGVADTLFHELGFLLRIPPVFLDQEGHEFLLDPQETVHETIKRIYLYLGGYQTAKRYNLVLDDGTPLYTLELDTKVSEAIPSLEIRYVQYQDELNDAKASLHWYSFKYEDDDFIRALAEYPEQVLLNTDNINLVLEDYNYTFTDVLEYFYQDILRGGRQPLPFEVFEQIESNEENLTRFVRTMVFRFTNNSVNLVDCVLALKSQGIHPNKYINWRELGNGEMTAMAYLGAVLGKTDEDNEVRTLLEGGKLDITNTSNVITLVVIDDIEFFYRHYDGDVNFLAEFLFGLGRVSKYLLENESPLKLYQAVAKRGYSASVFEKVIIERLSENGVRTIFKNHVNPAIRQKIIYKEEIAKRLPQDILDNDDYYKDPLNVELFLQNPKFHKYEEVLLVLLKEGCHTLYTLSELSERIGLPNMIRLFNETRNLQLIKIIFEEFPPEEILAFQDTLQLEPTLSNFRSFIKQPSRILKLFFQISRITRRQIIHMLCVEKAYYGTVVTIMDYFRFSRADALQLIACNPHYTLAAAIADLVVYEDIIPYITDKQEWLSDYLRAISFKNSPNVNTESILRSMR